MPAAGSHLGRRAIGDRIARLSSPYIRRLGARPFYSLCSTNTICGNIRVGIRVEVAVGNVHKQPPQGTLLERSEPMNRSTQWKILSPLLLALLLPILAACGGSPQAAAPTAPAIAAAPTVMAPAGTPTAAVATASGLNKLNHI